MKNEIKLFYDFEFHESFHKPLFGLRRHFIDLISIGMVNDSGRNYYAVCKEFDIKAAWNSYQIKMVSGDMRNQYPEGIREYWLRENVLKHIFDKHYIDVFDADMPPFNFKWFKYLINKIGKSRNQIALDIIHFAQGKQVKLIGYYPAYDHVLIASLFGKMINMPSNFPWYTIDLKQRLDEVLSKIDSINVQTNLWTVNQDMTYEEREVAPSTMNIKNWTLKAKLELIKKHPGYPKNVDEHDALSDAIFNRDLYYFIKQICL